MTQEDLIAYLNDYGCLVVRKDNKGYIVMRNPVNARTSGIPLAKVGKTLRNTTVCQICRNLEVDIPESAQEGVKIVDYVREKHIDKKED